MIVKNEEHIINECLENCRHLIDMVAVCDTGSSDKTVELINNFMIKYNIPGIVITRPWKNFGVNRTEAVRLAEWVIFQVSKGNLGPAGKLYNDTPKLNYKNYKQVIDMPMTEADFKKFHIVNSKYNGTTFLLDELQNNKLEELGTTNYYIMFKDADDVLHPSDEIKNISKNKKKKKIIDPTKYYIDKETLTHDCYYSDMGQHTSKYDYLMMIKCNPANRWRWVGVLHEYCTSDNEQGVTRSKHAYGWIESRRLGSRSKDPLKYIRDAVVFLEALIDEPENERYQFYLAQSWKDAGFYHPARDAYLKRAAMGKWFEEVYISYLEAGKLTVILEPANVEKQLEYFFKAFQACQTRLEAPFFILELMRKKELFAAAHQFGKPLADLPYPSEMKLFIDDEIHHWKFFDSLAVSSAQIGNKNLCRRLSERCLKYAGVPPEQVNRIKKNIAACSK